MREPRKAAIGAGFVVAIVAPLAGFALYPNANWLFGFVVLGAAMIAFGVRPRRESTAQEVAERAERLLNGTSAGWDVDDYEHLRPREPQLRELWQKTMSIGGLPEEWVRLDEAKKRELQSVIRAMRQLVGG